MGFADDLRAFSAKVETRNQAVFVNTCAHAKDSIQIGSPVTGAPGQPVKEGTLRLSWTLEYDSPTSALIASGGEVEAYNYQIEDGTRDGKALTLRSKVGGFHSVKLTIAGLQRIVDVETAKIVGGAK